MSILLRLILVLTLSNKVLAGGLDLANSLSGENINGGTPNKETLSQEIQLPTRASMEVINGALETIINLDHKHLFDENNKIIADNSLDQSLSTIKSELQKESRANGALLEVISHLANLFTNSTDMQREKIIWIFGILPSLIEEDINQILVKEINSILLDIIKNNYPQSEESESKSFGISAKAIIAMAHISAQVGPDFMSEKMGDLVSLIDNKERKIERLTGIEKSREQVLLRLLRATYLMSLRFGPILYHLNQKILSSETHIVSGEAIMSIEKLLALYNSFVVSPILKDRIQKYYDEIHELNYEKPIGPSKLSFVKFENMFNFLDELSTQIQFPEALRDSQIAEHLKLAQMMEDINRKVAGLREGVQTLTDAIGLMSRTEVMLKRQMERCHLRRVIGNRSNDTFGLFQFYDRYRGLNLNRKFNLSEDLVFSMNVYPREDDDNFRKLFIQRTTQSLSALKGNFSELYLEVSYNLLQLVEAKKSIIRNIAETPQEIIMGFSLGQECIPSWERPLPLLPKDAALGLNGILGTENTNYFQVGVRVRLGLGLKEATPIEGPLFRR